MTGEKLADGEKSPKDFYHASWACEVQVEVRDGEYYCPECEEVLDADRGDIWYQPERRDRCG